MSRKNRSRSAKKQKRKDSRKTKRNLRKMEKAGLNSITKTNVVAADSNIFGVNIGQNRGKSTAAEKPSTSRRCKKQLSPKKSPRKNKAGGKVHRFKKIVDDEARRIARRSVHSMNDSQRTVRFVTSKRISPHIKNSKRKINRQETEPKKTPKNISTTLEDGEIRSDIDKSSQSAEDDDDDDDCVVIEPTLEEITIDDNDDEDFPFTSEVSTNYESLMDSLKERVSSTPCTKRNTPTNVDSHKNLNDIKEPQDSDILPFFVDVGRGTDSINSTDNFADYIKLTTLREKSTPKRRSIRLKETSCSSEIIDLDDTSNDNMDVTLKRKSEGLFDDSVVFVSETNKNDFIPIVDDNIPPHKILKLSEPTHSTPVNKLRTNNLFTNSEKKKLDAYNENAYNPSSSKELKSGKRMVIIDGCNVAFKHGLDQQFSVKGLQIAIEYFEKMGHEVKAVIPQFRMNKTKSSNPDELSAMHKAGKIVQTPCKNIPGLTTTSYDDRFILQLAFATDAAIVSNDNYRDLIHENPAFKKIIENRVIGYTWCNDIFILPKDPYGKWGPTLDTILNRT